MSPEQTVHLDVRPDLAAGREPLSRIIAAARALSPGAALVVDAPFEPEPLYHVLERMGFAHATQPLDTGDGFRVTFTRRPGE